MNSMLTIPIQSPPDGKPFSLPMMTVFSITNHLHKTVAHALDFDLVCVAKTEGEALAKVRKAVKYHIEFGIAKGIERDILFPAPQRFWDALTPNSTLNIGEPIEIDSYRISTAYSTTTDECELSISAPYKSTKSTYNSMSQTLRASALLWWAARLLVPPMRGDSNTTQ